MMTTGEKIAWAAGIFDGEGCIHIGYVKPTRRNGLRNRAYRLTIKVTMGHKETILAFLNVVELGTMQNHAPANARVNASTSWVAQCKKGAAVLAVLRPYLVTKAAEADIALQFAALPDVARGGRGGSPEMNEELLRQKHALYVACAKLKSRYRFRAKPISEEIE